MNDNQSLVDELRFKWSRGESIEGIADFVLAKCSNTPLAFARHFHEAFQCGGHELIRFANMYCSGTEPSNRERLIQLIEQNRSQW